MLTRRIVLGVDFILAGDSNLKMDKFDSGRKAVLSRPVRRVLSADEAAQYLGYKLASASFYAFLGRLNVRPIRKGAYDKEALDQALDQVLGGREARVDYEKVTYG